MVRIKKTNPIQPKKPKKTVVKERSDKPYCCICMDEMYLLIVYMNWNLV